VISPVNVADDMGVQFLGEGVDLGVQLQLCSLFLEVVVSLRLLEGGLAILADHHECRQEDRLKRDDKRQRWRHHWSKPGCDRADGLVADRVSSITNFKQAVDDRGVGRHVYGALIASAPIGIH
jgi:hypothetical protein